MNKAKLLELTFDTQSNNFSETAVINTLRERGVCKLQNLFPPGLLNEISARLNHYYKRPAIAGVAGYYKVDFPKKLLPPGLIGPAVYPVLLNPLVISIIEKLMDSECVLAEAFFKYDRGVNVEYFPLHTDFYAGWKKSPASDLELSVDDMRQVLGIGAAVYMEDCEEGGAFCFCEGTHLWAKKGQNLWRYSPEEQKQILETKVRCDGKKGDMVLFDDRGFHGPDHPTTKDRSVLLLDYYRVKTFGFKQIAPLLIRTSDIDLNQYNAKQLRVLGLGAEPMVEFDEYTHTRFKKAPLYPLVSYLVENSYRFDFFKNKLKKFLRSKLRRGASDRQSYV